VGIKARTGFRAPIADDLNEPREGNELHLVGDKAKYPNSMLEFHIKVSEADRRRESKLVVPSATFDDTKSDFSDQSETLSVASRVENNGVDDQKLAARHKAEADEEFAKINRQYEQYRKVREQSEREKSVLERKLAARIEI